MLISIICAVGMMCGNVQAAPTVINQKYQVSVSSPTNDVISCRAFVYNVAFCTDENNNKLTPDEFAAKLNYTIVKRSVVAGTYNFIIMEVIKNEAK